MCRSGAMAPFPARQSRPKCCEGAKPRRAAATCTWHPDASAWFHRRTCCGTCTARAALACSRCSMPCSLRHGCRRRRAGAASAGFVAGLHPGIVPYGDHGRVHHDPCEVAVCGLFHAAVLFAVAGLVDAGAQAQERDQLLVVREPFDAADGDGHQQGAERVDPIRLIMSLASSFWSASFETIPSSVRICPLMCRMSWTCIAIRRMSPSSSFRLSRNSWHLSLAESVLRWRRSRSRTWPGCCAAC